MPRNVYDASPEQQEIIRWKDAKRRQLREIYMRDAGHPTKSLLCDTGVYRYSSAYATSGKRFVPTLGKFVAKMVIVGGLIGITYYRLEKNRSKREHEYRTGQVSYIDRESKFV